MLKRAANNPRAKNFQNYGARGITVEWPSFEAFYADMGDRPTPQHSIERLFNDGPYSKTNSVWALRGQQARNTRRNVNLTYNGITQCLADWALATGINSALHRIHVCWLVREQTLTTPEMDGLLDRISPNLSTDLVVDSPD